jgi:hypothetical protein
MITDKLKSFSQHCSNPRIIINKYTHDRILVPCGHCAACLNRISREQSRLCDCQKAISKYCYFITLTYDESSVPRAFIRSTSLLSDDPSIHPDDYTLIPAYDIESNEKDWHYTFHSTSENIRLLINKANSSHIFDDSIPVLRYRDIQLFQKRLRRNLFNYLGSYEKIHSYIVGEYGPVHFRPHWHLLLFFDSQEIAQVVHKCVHQSWSFGRIDCQPAEKGASSYVSSYINSMVSLPDLYQNCKPIRPLRRHSRFFGQGIFFQNSFPDDGTNSTPTSGQIIEHLSDKLSSGVDCIINANLVTVRPWRSIIDRIFPRLGINVLRDAQALSTAIESILSVPKIIAKFGYFSDSVMNMCRSLYKLLKLRNHEYSGSVYNNLFRLYGDKLDYIARLCRFSLYINAPEDKGLSALYRLMRPIFSLFRFQCIQSCDDSKFLTSVFKYTRESVNFYVKRFYNSLKTQYEVMSDYVNSEYADTKESFFQYVYQLLDYNGYSFLNNPLLQFSQTESIIQSQRLIKHKKLNDYNKLLINQLNT